MKKIFIIFMIIFISFTLYSERKIPCRIKDSSNIFITTLGNVNTNLSHGYFYPENDLVILKNGKIIKNYYKNHLKIKYYKPIDKTEFKIPPSGWCSWYYYYQEVNGDEIIKNAIWMKENLKEYGAKYIQIDDGWQGTGHGLGENRDWFSINSRFLNPSMKDIASKIKELGFLPGLWLAPHGESNFDIVKKNKKAFFLDKKDKSLSSTWEGTYLVKPNKYGFSYLKKLFKTLKSWGYEYFKIDGQPIVIREYQRLLKSKKKGELKYRDSLKAIREAIGDKTYLLGCWGIPLEGAGIYNGSRIAGDVWEGFSGFLESVYATMKFYYLHNIIWYSDPDVMLVRQPMNIEIARAWATLQGLTGQALMESDRMYELSEKRIEILKRIYPAVDIKPMDLFESKYYKDILDLKVSHLNRNYDVVGIFNFKDKKFLKLIDFQKLGLEENENYHVFDFWNKEYLGSWKNGFFVDVLPQGVRVITLVKEREYPILISTSRHITQGWVDLKELKNDNNKISGTSRIIKNDNYTLSFSYPHDKSFKIVKVKTKIKYKILNYDSWSQVILMPDKTGIYKWEVIFKEKGFYTYPVKRPRRILKIKPLSFAKFYISFSPQYYLTSGYNIYLNKRLIGHSPLAEAIVNIDKNRKVNEIMIKSVWYDNKESKDGLKFELEPKKYFEKNIYLSDFEFDIGYSGWKNIKKDLSVEGNMLSINRKKFSKGIGTHSNSKILYSLNRMFNRLKAKAGIDDETKGKGSVIFIIKGDDKILFKSKLVKANEIIDIDINITGINKLSLIIDNGGDGNDNDHADWVDIKLFKDNL